MHAVISKTRLRIGAGASGQLDPLAAAEAACDRAIEHLEASGSPGGSSDGAPAIDLALLFISMQHLAAAPAIAEYVRSRLNCRSLIGCTGEAVVAGDQEMENAPGVSLLALHAPGVTFTPFTTEQIESATSVAAPVTEPELDRVTQICGFGPSHRATVFFCDAFTTKLDRVLPLFSQSRARAISPNGVSKDRAAPGPILGGLASASGKPGGNVMFLNDRVIRSGGVGMSLSGPIRVDSIVSQGCKPITPTMIVTGVKGQMITSLGNRPALEVLNECIAPLPEETRQKLSRGLFIGRAVNEYKDRFGRDDFLIRNVIGVQRESEAIAIADFLKVGQTVQFYVRDAQTAHEDLALLLDAQKLYDAPAGVLLFTCNGRGTRLFERPHHDASTICRAFAPEMNAEQKAKGGRPLPALSAPLPLAGFFCAGEIGPVDDQIFLHTQTACAAVLRSAD
jgi:small ligand-binding sensory domain FIST